MNIDAIITSSFDNLWDQTDSQADEDASDSNAMETSPTPKRNAVATDMSDVDDALSGVDEESEDSSEEEDDEVAAITTTAPKTKAQAAPIKSAAKTKTPVKAVPAKPLNAKERAAAAALLAGSNRGGIKATRASKNEEDIAIIDKFVATLKSKRERAMFNHKFDLVTIRLLRMRNTCPLSVKPGLQRRTRMSVERHIAHLITKKQIEHLFAGA